MVSSLVVLGQDIAITGTITDGRDGSSMIGVTILQKGTTNGTTTDLSGAYSLKAPKDAILVFSFIGYETIEQPINGRTTINVTLNEATASLDEVIVIGYGVQKKSDKTGAVANVKAEELNGGILTDPIQGLQGKTAGVSITKKGGDPNSGYSVKIRGSAGLYSGTNPLYVIDGVPGADPTTISPEDIESYNILKDASSTAIYGSRGANGVIIITTKTGTKNAKPIFEYSSALSVDNVANRLDLMSANQLRKLASDYNLNLTDGGGDTDWQDAIYRTGYSQTHSISASGGSDNSTYRFTGTHSDFEGVIKGTAKARTVGRLNLIQKGINNRLTLQTTISGTIESNDYQSYSGNGNNDILYQTFQRNPTDPIYTADGEYYEIQREFNYYNPVALIEQIQNHRDAKRLLANLRADFEIVEGLKAGINLGYTRNDSENFYFEPSDVRGSTSTGFGKRFYDNNESRVLEATISYNNTFKDVHNVDLVGGYSFQEDFFDGFSAQGRSPLSDYVMSHNLGVLNDVNPGDISSYKRSNRLISFFGRAVYNYNSKYFVTATIRRDGSSKFGANNEWGLFPSASIGWNIKAEPFLSDIEVISQLKLRAGYGLAGNQEIDSYLDIMTAIVKGTTINPETGEPAIEFGRSHNINPDLRWEENSELNIGLDYGFLNNRFSGSIEYYDKTTSDLLAPYSVPVPPNAEGLTWANVGTIRNRGLEFNIQTFILDRTNLNWKTSAVFSTNRQTVESLSDKGNGYLWTPRKEGWLSGRGLVGDQNWTQIVAPGYELGTFYMPEYAGISADGKFLFYTAAGGVTRDLEKAERRVVGHALPDFEIGWSNYFTIYKNIDFSFAIRAVVGFDVLNVTRMVFANPSILPQINGLTEIIKEKERGLTDFPKVNSYYLEDGTFVRLDNVTLGYNFNASKINWLSKLRVYVTSTNLITLTNYSGLDPETTYDGLSFGLDQYNVYPKTRTFTFGVNATF
ncbi:MAG: SusC/RagA family TonB-linked outer membrane protein [Bacteroidales bacterium]|nr:SusC/RagA family TonB-linked outer membrane protein [Bacteroidales bacterium]